MTRRLPVSAAVGAVVAALGLALLGPAVAPTASAAANDSLTQSPAKAVGLDVPLLAVPRLRTTEGGWVVDAAVTVRAQHASGPLTDRVTMQVAVSTARGLVVGPRRVVSLSDGRGRATMTLTAEQAALLKTLVGANDGAARAVRVGVRHEANVDATHAGFDAIAVAQRRADWDGPLPQPPAGTPREFTQSLTYQNTTGSPLLLLSGPVSCMWDSNYPLENGAAPHNDFLAQSNGAILPAGFSFTTSTEASGDIDDNKFQSTSNAVLAAYASAITNSYQWYRRTSQGADLPRIPDRSTLPPEVTATDVQLIRAAVNVMTKDALDANGTLNAVYDTASAAASIAGAFGTATESFELGPLDQVLAILGAIITALESSCSTGTNSLLVGAIDMTHPWRQFVGFYDWGGSKPVIYGSTSSTASKTEYQPYSNGMVTYVYTTPGQGASTATVNDDYLVYNQDPNFMAVPILWRFTEPDINADHKAVISQKGRTVTCGLDPRDSGSSAAAMKQVKSQGASLFLTSWPVSVWQNLDNANQGTKVMPTGGASSYVDGIGYAAPGTPGVVSVYTSPDGQNWSAPILAPANSASVAIPAATTARLVQCTTQSVETWNNPITYNGRRVIMGTRVMSDMVLGPDD